VFCAAPVVAITRRVLHATLSSAQVTINHVTARYSTPMARHNAYAGFWVIDRKCLQITCYLASRLFARLIKFGVG